MIDRGTEAGILERGEVLRWRKSGRLRLNAGRLTPGHQRDNTTVLALTTLGQLRHGGPSSAWMALDHRAIIMWSPPRPPSVVTHP